MSGIWVLLQSGSLKGRGCQLRIFPAGFIGALVVCRLRRRWRPAASTTAVLLHRMETEAMQRGLHEGSAGLGAFSTAIDLRDFISNAGWLSPGSWKCCINMLGTKQLFMPRASYTLSPGAVLPVPWRQAAELTILLQFGPCSGAVGVCKTYLVQLCSS